MKGRVEKFIMHYALCIVLGLYVERRYLFTRLYGMIPEIICKFAASFPFEILFNGLHEIQRGGVKTVKTEVPRAL